MSSYSSPYVCQCSHFKELKGICINWDNNVVSGYDCNYPYCPQDCKLLKEFPIGLKRSYPDSSDY